MTSVDMISVTNQPIISVDMIDWLRGPSVEHWSLADVLSLSCAQPVADG